MSDQSCSVFEQEVQAALSELESIRADAHAQAPMGAGKSLPRQTGDIGTRYYEAVGRLEGAKRRYRAAIRALSECQGGRPA
jgi:hypothetical protein